MNLSKLKGAISEKRISRKELCVIWECSATAASNKVSGRSPITLEQAQRFAEYAHLSNAEKVDIFLS